MARRTLLRPGVVRLVLAWALVLGVLPAAPAAPLPPRAEGAGEVAAAQLERRLVTARLVALGLSPEDATRRVAALTEAERDELARRLDDVDAGGADVLAAVLAISIIVGLLTVLILELLGRRVISRP
jgi:hypothetical protein